MKKEIKKLVRHWQKELRLRDWIVSCEVAKKPRDKDGIPVLGQIHIWLEERRAVLVVKKPSAVLANDSAYGVHQEAFELERIVVHELLHLYFEYYDTMTNPVPLEQAINALADKLVADKYKGELK